MSYDGVLQPWYPAHKHPYLILQATKRMPVARVQWPSTAVNKLTGLLLLSFFFLFLFLLSFYFVTVILEILGLKKPAFWHLFTQMTTHFVRVGFQKIA